MANTRSEISLVPQTLPDGLEWTHIDVSDPQQLTRLCKFLSQNYVEDACAILRLHYTEEFLRHVQSPPHKNAWSLGVTTKDGCLIGYIAAVSTMLKICTNRVRSAEVNFLCVHKEYRDRRLAPLLIAEITRRINLAGIFQAVFTGQTLPSPHSVCRYYHRAINTDKLIDVGFIPLHAHQRKSVIVKLYEVRKIKEALKFTRLTSADARECHRFLTAYLDKFLLAQEFSFEEFLHHFVNPGVVRCFIAKNSGRITDMISYYALDSAVLGNPKHKIVHGAYSFYNIATSMSLSTLMACALNFAKDEGFDVFNCLDLMDNRTFLHELRFVEGNAVLNYYLHQKSDALEQSSQNGLVMF